MSISDRRLNNASKQKSRLQEREEQTRESSNQTKELVQYDKYSGKWYALNPSNGNLILDKAYNSKSAVLKVVNKTALGKNVAKPPTEPQPEKRPSEPIGYHKGQVFKFPKTRPKKLLQYPIKYLYSVIEEGVRNYYIGGFQDKPVQLPVFPFEPTAFFLQNTGQDGFVLGLSRGNQIAYYENFNLVYNSVFSSSNRSYLGFGYWYKTAVTSQTDSTGTSSYCDALNQAVSNNQTISTFEKIEYTLFSNEGQTRVFLLDLLSFIGQYFGIVCYDVTVLANNGTSTINENKIKQSYYSNSFDTLDFFQANSSQTGVSTGDASNRNFNDKLKFFQPLSLFSNSQTRFGYFVESTSIKTIDYASFQTNKTWNISGNIFKAFFSNNLVFSAAEAFSFQTSENDATPPTLPTFGFREDYYINTDLYKEITNPELKFESFSGLFCSVKVSESIEDSITAGSRVAVWQVKSYDTQFQLVEDAFYNAWLPHVESGFTVHSTSYHPLQ